MKVTFAEFTGRTAMRYYITMVSNALISDSRVDAIEVIVPESFEPPRRLDDRVTITTISISESIHGLFFQSISPVFLKNVFDAIERGDPDVIHFLSEIRTPAPVLVTASYDRPIALTIHEPDPYVPTWKRRLIMNPLQELNTRIMALFADTIFVHGQNSRSVLTGKNVVSEKIEVYPLGGFPRFFTRHLDEVSDMDDLNVLYFGRIFPGKGVPYLLDAAKILEEADVQGKLIIAGSGDPSSIRGEVRRLDNVELRNEFVDEEEVGKLFERASIVVLPYVDGSQSGIIGTAASFETPVVVTDVGNFSEMVEDGETGLVVPPEDEQALADALLRLLRDDEVRRRMGKTAKSFYKNELAWDNSVDTIVSSYQRIREK